MDSLRFLAKPSWRNRSRAWLRGRLAAEEAQGEGAAGDEEVVEGRYEGQVHFHASLHGLFEKARRARPK